MAFKILSIDGGGIRGIIPGQILVALEQKLQAKTNNPEARIGDYFDMVAGTSTGAILTAAYVCPDEKGRPKFTAQEAVDFYIEDGDDIFDVGFWRKIGTIGGLNDEKYSAKELERVLENAFGDTKLSELLKPTCFISYDIRQRRPIVFTQHDAVKKNKDFLVRDLLRGSSAAPTYFETARIYSLGSEKKKYVLVDGGMVANDPTLCAYSEAITFKKVSGIKNMMILSLGTGKQLKPYAYSEVKDWGPIGWAKPAINIAVEGGPQMTAYHMESIASTVKGSKFIRIQPDLYGADFALDNASPENLQALKSAGIKNAKKFDKQLDVVVKYLIKNQPEYIKDKLFQYLVVSARLD